MKNLLELGKNLVKEMKDQYKDCFYRYVDENSFNDETYVLVGKELFDNKKMYLDYMNHLYLDDFDWLKSEVNSFDFIQELVDVKVEESKKYKWSDEEEAYLPVVEYDDFVKGNTRDVLIRPCYIVDSKTGKSLCIKGYEEKEIPYGYIYVMSVFSEQTTETISEQTIEINGRLNLYLELDNSVWDAKDGDKDIENKITKEKKDSTDLLIECLNELIENNPDTLKKYGLNQIIPNVHEVRVQEL